MKKMKPGARSAAVVVASFAALIGAKAGAQAQAWIEVRPWAAPRYYEAPPIVTYRHAPRFEVEAEFIPRNVVRRIIERRGLEVIGPIRLTGEVYIVPVEDRRGRVDQIVVDAFSGEIVERLGASGLTSRLANERANRLANDPPRPPVNVGRRADRNVVAPHSSDLPPPRSAGRELYARQHPGGVERPRGRADEFNFAPGSGRVPPLPPRREVEATPGEAAATRSAKPRQAEAEPRKAEAAKTEPTKPEQVKPTQQAARTPPAEKPQQVSPSVVKPETSKPETPKAEATGQDSAKARASTKSESLAAKPAESGSAANKVEGAQSPVGGSASSRPPASKPAVSGHNSALLLRPKQDSSKAMNDERRGVAEGPTTSSGAEPQRKSPRIVYPGPGAPAQPATSDSE